MIYASSLINQTIHVCTFLMHTTHYFFFKFMPNVFSNWKGKRVDKRWHHVIKENIKKFHW